MVDLDVYTVDESFLPACRPYTSQKINKHQKTRYLQLTLMLVEQVGSVYVL